ncbi:WecB/TagA/CpsF family glycosyltransferase [Microcoleus sp. FACHB-1515]|uniref:WecB/TagA/CpsF family glycosyltransferase n=1 Tax=Cyanophyceae TaxID=3028117 RepID=UPI00168874C3|nr:WecB/TagA/CpsF family glycosyltransferase [Microcoleus sp. FACHB-1515]MBD2089663.1 WecB/TagA/CpsF family glycosyltransferase [Microcoleus sp. FACHB-1515]
MIKILNLNIHNFSRLQLLNDLDRGVVFTPNVDHLMKLQHDTEFYEAYCAADYVVCDSKIVLWASKFLRTPLKEKISGSDLFPAFYEHHRHNEEIKIFLLGARQGVACEAQRRINAKVGRSIVVAAHSPSFGFEKNEAECEQIIEMVNRSGATVLAIGVGAPKQEKFIHEHKHRMPGVKIFLAIGATIDFEAGNVKRSPRWISEMGMEWIYRLIAEPRRLWKRYLIEDLPFVWLILKQKLNLYAEPFSEMPPVESHCFQEGFQEVLPVSGKAQ